MFIALSWDHAIAQHFISWIVVECGGVGEKFGLPQALPPRRDVAYFCGEAAEHDAKAFAEFKNSRLVNSVSLSYEPYLSPNHGYCHYAWDHCYLRELIKFAVLYWENGKHQKSTPTRDDVAYFLCDSEGEQDAAFFAQHKLNERR
ncbi:hypothetical protein [Pseudoalteromonas xiamenensis]|uniref:hypothetical protein n=1 Tax=Pseudoalteromonas xiamenensis TaxID=882626 RepID=UPI0035E6D38E